jgi:DNA-binding response OmpR family regulator
MAASKQTILLILNEQRSPSLQQSLEKAGYAILTAPNYTGMAKAAQQRAPALVVADRQLCTVKTLRMHETLRDVPVISLGLSGTTCSEDECLADYHDGADLVLCNQTTKELIAWVRALLRRAQTEKTCSRQLLAGGIRIDLDRHEVRVRDKLVELTPKEFQILRYFLERPNRAFSREDVQNYVWGDSCALGEHALDVHIHCLRKKIEGRPARPKLIVTVRGIGYKLRAPSPSVHSPHQLTSSEF